MEIGPSTYWTGSWVSPRAGLNTMKEKKSLASAENQIPIPQSLNLQPSPYTDCAIPAPFGAPCI